MDEPLLVDEASRDNFTDEQHKRLDEDVTSTASVFFPVQQELSSKCDCAGLLQCIIEHSEGTLKGEFTNTGKAVKLMRENPKLEFALKNAWRTKDYKKIRRLSELRASSLVTLSLNSLPAELLTVKKPHDYERTSHCQFRNLTY